MIKVSSRPEKSRRGRGRANRDLPPADNLAPAAKLKPISEAVTQEPMAETGSARRELKEHSLYFNRELSWLEFNRRVLDEARDLRHPLLERVKFLAIFSTNLDEFFMIRVSGLKDQLAAGITPSTVDGMTPREILAEIRTRVLPMLQEQRYCFYSDVLPALSAAGIDVLHYGELAPEEQDQLRTYFVDEVLPVVTPLAFDPGRPFPHISNLSLNLAVLVRGPAGDQRFRPHQSADLSPAVGARRP
jgi:polyphosphate kinase